jgi:hypothetical protein
MKPVESLPAEKPSISSAVRTVHQDGVVEKFGDKTVTYGALGAG